MHYLNFAVLGRNNSCLHRHTGNDMRLTLATEYPSGALPGEAMSTLATLVQEAVGVELTIDSLFEVKQALFGMGVGSDVHVDGGSVFGASLSQHANEFELAAIPRGARRSDSEQD